MHARVNSHLENIILFHNIHNLSNLQEKYKYSSAISPTCEYYTSHASAKGCSSSRGALQDFMARFPQSTYAMVLNPSTQVQALPPTIPDLAEAYCAGNFSFPFQEFISKNVRESEILVLKKSTIAQSISQVWLKHRIGALTSTTMHSAANSTRGQTDNYIVREILGQSNFLGIAATKYGKDSEPIARKLYTQDM